MDRYIGVDAHSQNCTLVVVGPSGKRLKTEHVETQGTALRQAVLSIMGRRHICLEEGELSGWLADLFLPIAHQVGRVGRGHRQPRAPEGLTDWHWL